MCHFVIVCVSGALCGPSYIALWQAVPVHIPLYICTGAQLEGWRIIGVGMVKNMVELFQSHGNKLYCCLSNICVKYMLSKHNYSTGISQNSSTIIFPKQSDYFIEFLDYTRVIKPSLNFIATVSPFV